VRSRQRKLTRALKREGWTFDGVTGNSHLRWRHLNGSTLHTSMSPTNPDLALRAALREARRKTRA
jgi:predicted RNA binding protein YcfA (HicA-like mRNA interferase family)